MSSEPVRGNERLSLRPPEGLGDVTVGEVEDILDDAPSFTLRDYAAERPWSADEEKHRGGTWVAKAIVVTFAASVVFWFALLFTLILSGRSAEEVAKFTAVLGTLLKDYATFAGVFSPLLAFVLGFYFGDKKG
jgi:hypothetical protein